MPIDYVDEMLKAYFGGYEQKEKIRQFDAQQAYNKSRLQQELDLHRETMAQRGKEFVNENAFKSAQLAISKQNADRAASREAREERNQVRDDLRAFTKDGEGYFMPEPQDQPIPYQMGGGQQPMPDLSFLGAPKPPVGPTQLQALGYQDTPEGEGQAIMQEMPMSPMPTIPMEGMMPAQAQMPPSSYAQPLPAMEGQPEGTIAMQKTNQQLAFEKQKAAYDAKHAEDIEVPKEVQEWFGGNLPPKLPLDGIVKLAEARTKDLETRAARADNNELKRELANQANDTRKFLGLLADQKKGTEEADIEDLGKSLLDNPDFANKVPSKNIPAVTKWLREKYDLPYPTAIRSAEATKADASRKVIQYIGDILEETKDPQIMANFGPVMGRNQDLTQNIGQDYYNKNPYLAQRLQSIRTKLNYLLFGEGQSLVGGRVPQRVLDEVRKTSPNTHFALPLLLGSLVGVVDNAKENLTGIEQGRGKGWASRKDFVDSLPKTKQEIKPSPAIIKATPVGATTTVGGHTIFHAHDGKFYKVDIEIPKAQ